MKSNSIRILLEVGQFLNRKEKDLQTVFTSEQKFLYDEMNLIRNVILLDLGVVKLDGKQCEIINDDIYDAFSNVYWAVCETEADVQAATDFVLEMKKADAYYAVNGVMLKTSNPTDVINTLFDLKYTLQLKRKKVGHLMADECDFFRAEKRVLHVILDELGKRRYF